MASQIKLKRSTTASEVPTTSDVAVGEVAINTEDKRLFTQDSGGSVVELGTNPTSLTVGDVTSTGTVQFGSLSDGTITVTAFADEDTFASDSATLIPTQQSVKAYVDTEITNLIGGAPGALDTLNELAAAINDDADVYNTLNDAITLKAPLASPALTGTPTAPTAAADTNTTQIATTAYVQTEVADYLPLAGGTMTGDITLGANAATSTADPTTDDELARKGYVDTILGSATDAATSATNAATSATNAATSATNAATSETNAATSATNAAASYDSFDDRYLGVKATAPALDNDGDALVTGALYFDSTVGSMYVYDGASWGTVAPTATSVTVSQVSDLTATASELNTLDGFTGDVTALNRLDITTEGQSEASKVITANSNGDVSIPSGYLYVSGGAVYAQTAFSGDVDPITSSSGTLSIDVRDANTFTHTLTENTTLALTNTSTGYTNTMVLYVVQDSSASGYTLSFPSGTKYVGGTAPTLTTTASAVDVLVLHWHSNVLHVYVAGQDVKA